ncbi:MAG TPA: S8 family serine peptidase [Myxococcales bacterium]|jgi:subtilisin family serine protease|nr:S8 family serine peptidase [Myxococcales bacterium]
MSHTRPWQPESTRTPLRGRLLVRLRDDEARPAIPARVDVAAGLATPGAATGWDKFDAAVKRHSPWMQITRAYHAKSSMGRPGRRHLGYDPLERELGFGRTFRVKVHPGASVLHLADDLRSLDGVELASPVYLSQTPFAVASAVKAEHGYAQKMVRAAEALRIEPGDSALIIGIVDSGVALDHPELSGKLRTGTSTVHIAPDGLPSDFKLAGDSDGPRPLDRIGHGTSCASIIAARGLQMPPGLAGVALALPIRALAASYVPGSKSLSAVGRSDDIDLGVKTAVDLGARVVNLSFGTPGSALRADDPLPHVDVVQYALRRDCVLVAASGNGGDDVPFYPAALPGVIAVGACGADGRPAHFSSRGKHVALCAPGEGIPAAVLTGYGQVSGTSFAAPFVAAAAALLIARASREGIPISAFNVRSLLIDGAVPFAGGADSTGCGAGILDCVGSLKALDSVLDDSLNQEREGNKSFAGALVHRRRTDAWAAPQPSGG